MGINITHISFVFEVLGIIVAIGCGLNLIFMYKELLNTKNKEKTNNG